MDLVRGPVRVAIRRQGEFVVFFAANLDSMDGAYEILRVPVQVVEADRKIVLQELAQAMTNWLLRRYAALGIEVARIEQESAPEHERAGRA